MRRKLLCILLASTFIFGLSGCKMKIKEKVETKNSKLVSLETPSGPINGLEFDGVYMYKGVPYANPPVDELRFAPPQPVTPWTEALDCTEFGATAYQPEAYKELPMSEDCLTLNVWTPEKPETTEKLPVYVFIHGGGYANGTGAKGLYEGTRFAQDGIVTITINYRLNALGFFASQETLDQYGTTGNWGHLDQIEALKWLKGNVQAFGGDPNNITIGGESAGSYSVSALISSPLAEGLFQKGIMESGSILSLGTFSYEGKGNLEKSIELSREFSNIFGASDDKEGLETLRKVDPGALSSLSPFDADQTKTAAFAMWPVYDGKVLPKDPVKELKAGNMNKVKVLMGYNTDEATIFINSNISQGEYVMLVNKMFHGEKGKAILERYPVDENHTPGQRAQEVVTLANFRVGMKTYADALTNNGQDVYTYEFAYPVPLLEEIGLGAFHGYEIPFVFGNNLDFLKLNEYEKNLAEGMHLNWVNFIKNGDPNVGEPLPLDTKWEKYTSENNETLKYGETLEMEKTPKLEDIEFFENLMFGETPYYN